MKLSDLIKSYGHLSKILAYFGRFYPDLSLIILKSRDHGCQFKKFLNFICSRIKFQEKSPNFKELAQKLQELWTNT